MLGPDFVRHSAFFAKGDCSVALIEPMGSETLLHLNAGGHDIRVVIDRRRRVEVGDRLHARWAAERVHVFDGEGERVGR